jgi:Tfp pilus assembly protein PilP
MKKARTLFVLFFTGLVALEGLGITAQEGPSIQKIIPTAQKKNPASMSILPQPTVPPLPKMSDPTTPFYNPTGKPDPFMPTTVSTETKSKGKKKVLPLEQFEVNEFELVGVVTGSGIRQAMVQDLTGKGYYLQVGTPIGKMGGKVIQISEKTVVIKEPFYDFLGRRSSRDITLKFPQTQYGIP